MSYYRGRRGDRSWRGSSRSTPQQGPIVTPPAPPLGDLLSQVTPEECIEGERDSQMRIQITDTRLLASYNWVDAGGPSIVFPGMPPVWNPPSDTVKLEEDTGKYFRDANAARHPDHPMEPAAKAVIAQNPHLDTGNIDVFACTSTLGNLLRFLKNDDKTFRFTVEAVGRTVFFVRRENAPDELIAGPRGYGPTGHGHAFPERYTRWDNGVKDSTSHQRIISYQFGGLSCLVRFEADGYLEEELAPERERDATSGDSAPAGKLEIDNISIRSGGKLIPQHTIFELKTRGVHKKNEDHMSDNLPRMWLAQIPFFILAFHHYGSFKPEDITVQDVRKEVAAWQGNNQALLHKLSVLLAKLVTIARDPDVQKYEVCVQKQGLLEIREQGGTVSSPLPSPLTWIWADHESEDDDTKSNSDGISVGSETSDPDLIAHSDADDDDFVEDFTACSDACDYCGRCSYKTR